MFTKRTIVMNSLDSSMNKAVANFENVNNEVKGNIRLYNFKSEPNGVLTLGILAGGEVYKAGLTKCGLNQYEFRVYISGDVDVFTCALVNSYNGEIKPLLIGASNGASSESAENRLASSLGVLQKKDMKEVEKVLNENQIELEENIDKIVDEEMKKECGENCILCPYKKAFYEEEISKPVESLKINVNNELKEEISEPEKEVENTFYNEISDQIELLFNRYGQESELERIIPNSKWVKVDFDESGTYYVIGLIYEHEMVKYICYGVPGMYSDECPKELEGTAQWLPLDENMPQGTGYWISYQDASNGENIKIEVV